MTKQKLFKIKSWWFVICTVISAFLIFLFGIWIWAKAVNSDQINTFAAKDVDTSSTIGEIEFSEASGNTPMQIWKNVNGHKSNDFKILTSSDFHLKKNKSDLSIDILQKYIQQDHPDLVVLCGDNIIDKFNPEAMDRLINMFEQEQQYWTFVLGNHDGQPWGDLGYWQSRQKAFEVESGFKDGKYATHCLARCAILDQNNPEKYGYGTNEIDVLGNDDNIIQKLFFFDCMAVDKSNIDMDNWLSNRITSEDNITIFNHKPFKQMKTAYDSVGKDTDVTFHYGIKKENICYDGNDSSVFDFALKAKFSTLVFGHDHINNICLSYKNVKMLYSLGMQYCSYNSRQRNLRTLESMAYAMDNSVCGYIDGVTELVINNTNSVIIGNKYNQFSGVLNGLEGKLYVAVHHLVTYNALWLSICLQIILPISALICSLYWTEFIIFELKRKK